MRKPLWFIAEGKRQTAALCRAALLATGHWPLATGHFLTLNTQNSTLPTADGRLLRGFKSSAPYNVNGSPSVL